MFQIYLIVFDTKLTFLVVYAHAIYTEFQLCASTGHDRKRNAVFEFVLTF